MLSLLLRTWFPNPLNPQRVWILVQLAVNDAHFRKAWMPYFREESIKGISPHFF